jgi:hypothetical protein
MAQKPAILKRHYGGGALGEYYWPRPEVTEPILDALGAGESISLFGLRRTGKSSTLLEICRTLSERGRSPVYVDVQGRDRIDSIVGALVSALPSANASSRLTKVLSAPQLNKALEVWHRVTGSGTSGPPNPLAVLHQVELIKGDLNALFAAQNRSIILIVDELPYLIVNMLDAGITANSINTFLATLRTWRHEGRVPMLFAGSMGLQWLMRERGIARENFNDLVPYTTPPPLEDDDARAMLQALARGENCDWINNEIIDVILAESAAKYPSFLQFAFGRIKGHGARSVPEAISVFEQYIRPSLDEDFYDQFDTRLARYDSTEKEAARAIFRRLGGVQGTVALAEVDSLLVNNDESLRDHLLLSLVEDGFARVDTRARTIGFSSPLVQTWWQSKPYRR